MFTSDTDESLLEREHSYSIEKLIVSTASIVLVIREEELEGQWLCAKMWVDCDDKLYEADEPGEPSTYLRRGLEFNENWAPGVYLGIAPIQLFAPDGKRIHVSDGIQDGVEKVLLGPLIKNPSESELEVHKEYAIVMKYLEEEWSLEKQLQGKLGNLKGMEFLARKIADRHQSVQDAPLGAGDFSVINSKLEDNLDIFDELNLQGDGAQQCTLITRVMREAVKLNQKHFERRQKAIKRCHGDLKVANLWVAPEKDATVENTSSFGTLLALDCIDFKSAFYHIDTLSDIAMLAIDLEVHFAQEQRSGQEIHTLVNHFLETYLTCMFGTGRKLGDATTTWLLEYYMTEKAIVRTYMSMKYEHEPKLGKRYLACAHLHAEKLHALKE